MANQIVTVNVSVIQAPEPNTLQKRGAMVSQGGTIQSVKGYSLLTQESDLAPLLPAALALSSLAYSAGVVTATAGAAHGVTVGQQFITTIAGAVPTAYNGMVLATATTSTAFTYYLATDPVTTPATTAGTYTRAGVGDLEAMVDTFFSQGATQGCWVLELGSGTPAEGVVILEEFIQEDPFFYSFLLPKSWDNASGLVAMMGDYEAPDAKTYFWGTSTEQYYSIYDGIKSANILVENPVYGIWPQVSVSNAAYATGVATVTTSSAHGVKPGMTYTLLGILPAGYNGTFVAQPGTTGSTLKGLVASDPGAYSSGGNLVASSFAATGVPSSEYTHAADWYRSLNYDPNPSNRVAPFSFTPMRGVTEFTQKGNQALLATFKGLGVNFAGNGGEGGISNKILYWGTMMDVRPFNYWYAIDYAQIECQLALANAVINGSANAVNPLYMNQEGIDRLQQAVVGVANRGVACGLFFGRPQVIGLPQAQFLQNLDRGDYAGTIAINAVPFSSYYSLNPSDYRIGKYAGLTMVFAPQLGFTNIVFNLVATDLVASAT